MSRDVLARIIGKGWPEILLPQWGSFLRECIHLPKKNCVGVPDFLGCEVSCDMYTAIIRKSLVLIQPLVANVVTYY